MFVPKNICVGSSHSFWISEFTTTMGEALNWPCTTVSLLYGTSKILCTKIVAIKEAKWKEIAEILHLNKEEVIRKWKSLRDTYVRHKNNKSKSGDGLSQCKPKWKYYDIMSFIDITLLKRRYVPIYLITSYLQQIYTPNRQLCVIFDHIKNGHVCFNILVLCPMLLMRGEEDKSDNEGQEQVSDNLDTQIDGRLAVNCICIQQQGHISTTLNPLQETNTRQEDALWTK